MSHMLTEKNQTYIAPIAAPNSEAQEELTFFEKVHADVFYYGTELK